MSFQSLHCQIKAPQLLIFLFGQILSETGLRTIFIGILKHVTYIRLEKNPKPLHDKIEIEPAANRIGNKTLSAIRVIHRVEHTCGEGKHIVPVKTAQVSENG